MLYALDRFNQYAVKENLSAGAILLWHRLYVTMQRRGQFANVLQQTSVLMAMLSVSRQGLQQMRQMLVDKGFLAIRQDEHQQIFYTLLLNGVELTASKVQPKDEPLSDAAKQALCEPLAQKKVPAVCDLFGKTQDTVKPMPSGDIIISNRYRQYIDAFCNKFGDAMKQDLLQWADMRRKNGWTLTLWGLEAVLKNLLELSAGDAVQMGRIVAQSVKRRWKGFYALKVQAKPSGAKLLQMEAKEQRTQQGNRNQYRQPMQKFAPEGRDLSFLER